MREKNKTLQTIIFGVILPIVTLIIMLTVESNHINSLKEEYVNVIKKDEVNGIIGSIKTRKGGCYITLNKDVKIHLYPSRNYLYEISFLDKFLHVGDRLCKEKGNDTLFVYRNEAQYYFVLGEIINR